MGKGNIGIQAAIGGAFAVGERGAIRDDQAPAGTEDAGEVDGSADEFGGGEMHEHGDAEDVVEAGVGDAGEVGESGLLDVDAGVGGPGFVDHALRWFKANGGVAVLFEPCHIAPAAAANVSGGAPRMEECFDQAVDRFRAPVALECSLLAGQFVVGANGLLVRHTSLAGAGDRFADLSCLAKIWHTW